MTTQEISSYTHSMMFGKPVWSPYTDHLHERIDFDVLRTLAKAAIAPTIGLALYQWTPYAEFFGTFGYLVPTASIILSPYNVRAVFLREAFFTLVLSAVSCAIYALALFSIVKARSPTPDGGVESSYDSSASAVVGVWLVFVTFPLGCIVTNPRYAWPASSGLVFSNFGLMYATRVTSISAAWQLWRQITVAMYTGFAISIVVSVAIFPRTARGQFRAELERTTQSYLSSLDRLGSDVSAFRSGKRSHPDTSDVLSRHYLALGQTIHHAEMEPSLSSWSPTALKRCCVAWQDALVPMIALEEFLCSRQNLDLPSDCSSQANDRGQLLDQVAGVFQNALLAQRQAIQNVAALMVPSPKKKEKGDISLVLRDLVDSMTELVSSKTSLVLTWEHMRSSSGSTPDKQALHDVFHLSYLLWVTCLRAQGLVTRMEDMWSTDISQGVKLHWPILPTSHASFHSLLRSVTATQQRDLKHKAAESRWERISEKVHLVSEFFQSQNAVIGMRITFATMTMAIIGLLKTTQGYFLNEHLVWAQYVVSMIMQSAVGQSWRKFMFRLVGTIAAVLMAIVSWYAGGQVPTGTLIWYAVFQSILMYFPVKYPRYSQLGFVPAFALGVILGLVLQARKDRSAHLAQASEQANLPVWKFGLLRLAAICYGLVIGLVWTVFPYPISDKDLFLRRLASGLANMATYNEATFALVRIRFDLLSECNGKTLDRAALTRLEALCSNHHMKSMSLIATLRSELEFIKFEVPIGGSFPREQYIDIIDHLQRATGRLQLIGLASSSLEVFLHNFSQSPDIDRARQEFYELQTVAEWSTSMFVMLSQCVSTDTSLAPHIWSPANTEPHPWTKQSAPADPLDSGYLTMIAVRQWAQGVQASTTSILGKVKEVVGELDVFSV